MTARPGRWTMEDLLDSAGNLGAAHAAARFGNDDSARRALTDLDSAVRGLHHDDPEGDDTYPPYDGDAA